MVWHETVFLLCFAGTAVFYIYVFAKTIDALSLVVSCIVLVLTALLQETVSTFVFLYALAGASFISFFQGHAITLYQFGKSAFSGFFEEFFRSVFVVLYAKARRKSGAKKDKTCYSYIKALDNQVFGLAFLYGFIESGRMMVQAFPALLTIIKERTLSVDILGTSQLAGIHPVYMFIFAAGIVLRYYIHLCFLKFSIYSLAAGQKRLYLLALFFHFSAGATLGYFGVGVIEHVIISVLVIELVFVGATMLLLRKLNLRTQVTERSSSQQV